MAITDDEIFEAVEHMCLVAVDNPNKLTLYKYWQRRAQSLEHNGWKRRTGMTQHDIVLKHMRKNGSISPHEAIMDHNITRLAARVFELKNKGYDIIREMRTNPTTGKSYARYRLAS